MACSAPFKQAKRRSVLKANAEWTTSVPTCIVAVKENAPASKLVCKCGEGHHNGNDLLHEAVTKINQEAAKREPTKEVI